MGVRTFARKSKAPRSTAAKSAAFDQAQFRRSHQAHADGQAVDRAMVSGAAGFSFDFSRIPVHAPAPAVLQPKLAIGSRADVCEQEADRVADQVMAMPQAAPGREPLVQRSAPGEGGTESVPEIVHDVLRSPGRPLDAVTRAFMEPRFGRDFSQVRVHADAEAAEAAASIHARAFTANRGIAFGAGQYAPQTQSGRGLLAHELTHVIQQSAGNENADLVIQRQEAAHGSDDVHKVPPIAPDASHVAKTAPMPLNVAERHSQGVELRLALFKLLDMLKVFESRLQGHATQSRGLIIHGTGDGKDSPATPASKDAKIWGSFDFAAFMELMGTILDALPEGFDRRPFENLQEAAEKRDYSEFVQIAHDIIIPLISRETEGMDKDTVEKKQFAEQKTGSPKDKRIDSLPNDEKMPPADSAKNEPGRLETVKQFQPGVADKGGFPASQWLRSDGNWYLMIKYSDGSKAFFFISGVGNRKLNYDPGFSDSDRVRRP